MKISIIQAIGPVCLALVTTAGVSAHGRDTAASTSTPSATHATSASTAPPGLPADFPLAPGLSACKPIVVASEIICDWHGVDGHAMYVFYHDALPKAGYTLLPGASEASQPHYLGVMGFKKGALQGAVSITGGDLTIQILTGT